MRELTPRDYLAMLRRRCVLIVCLTVIGCGSALVAAHFLPKRFVSQTTVLVEEPTVPVDIARPVVTEDINQRLSTMQQQILSRSRLEPVIRQYDLYSNDAGKASMEELVERLRKTITITPLEPMAQSRTRNLPGFNVSVTSGDPRLAQQICSTITSMFMEQNLQLRQDQVDQTVDFIRKQLADAKTKLDDQDAKLAVFKRRYLGSLPDEEQTNLNLLMGLNSQLEATTQALSRAQQDKGFAESILGQQLSAWQASQVGQNPETFEQQLSALQAQLLALRTKYTDDHPDVIKAKNDIATLKRQIAASEEQKKASTPEKATTASGEPAQIQQLRAQLHQYEQVIKERSGQQEDIQKQIKLYQARVQSSPAVEQEYKQLTRDYQTALEFYNELSKKLDQATMANDLERRQQGGQFRVLDAANLPDMPSFPNPTLFGLGGFAGGAGLGLALAFLLEMQDTSLRSERDVEVALRLPVLAKLPTIVPEPTKTRMQTSLGSGIAKTGAKA
jgi:polysaccharide chain length determinant protein (PEP-CTERM system associated)